MRIVLVVDRTQEDPELAAAAEATGAEIQRVFDIEDAVDAVRRGEADAILSAANEVERLTRGPAQISSYLRHRITNPLTTVLGQAQLLQMGVNRDPASDQAKFAAIVEQALRIRALLTGQEAGADAG